MSDEKRPIIIKKIKKIEGGHHGGAWKVAYADFVTAMMAFFLLLWLISQVPTEKLTGLADYFTPSSGVRGKTGDTGKGGQGQSDAGVSKDGGLAPSTMQGAPNTYGDIQKVPETDDLELKEYDGSQLAELPEFDEPQENMQISDIEDIELKVTDEKSMSISENDAEKVEEALEKKRFDELAEELKEQIENNVELKEFSENLKIDQTEEGLRIQITDVEGKSMYELGSAQLRIESEPLLAKVSEMLQKVDNRISIIGHTDSLGYSEDAEYTNWELSADRANSSRRFLIEAGLNRQRIHKVEGMADKYHFDPANPNSPENRRISIIVIKKSLVPIE